MEILSAEFLSALLTIIIIDMVMAGDNAIVIALAARSLPPQLRTRAVVWGTVGAIAVRAAMTLVVVWLLRIPGLLFVGGLVLIWIAYKLLVPKEDASDAHGKPVDSFWEAMKTIIIADALMGLDNVLAVAGAAKGSFLLVILGLLISIPIVVWGSTLILKWVDRFPVIVYIGAGVLAMTAVQMMLQEPMLAPFIEGQFLLQAIVYAGIIGGVLLAGRIFSRRRNQVVSRENS